MDREVVLDKEMIIVSETDEKGNILYVNDDFCKIAKYSKDELIGKAHNIVRHPDMPKDAFRDLWNTIKKGDTWKGIVKNLTKDGEYYWVNATVYATKTTENNLKYISVRVAPTPEEIENAQKLYESMD
jgi:aerotaxis receptor